MAAYSWSMPWQPWLVVFSPNPHFCKLMEDWDLCDLSIMNKLVLWIHDPIWCSWHTSWSMFVILGSSVTKDWSWGVWCSASGWLHTYVVIKICNIFTYGGCYLFGFFSGDGRRGSTSVYSCMNDGSVLCGHRYHDVSGCIPQWTKGRSSMEIACWWWQEGALLCKPVLQFPGDKTYLLKGSRSVTVNYELHLLILSPY